MDKEALVKFNGFLAPKAEGSYLILNEGGYQIEGQTDTWKVIDEKNVQEQRFVQLVCEQTKKQKPDIVLHDSGVLVAQTVYGFDSSVMKKIEKFLREQKPELLHHQKFLENGTAERAKEYYTQEFNKQDTIYGVYFAVFSVVVGAIYKIAETNNDQLQLANLAVVLNQKIIIGGMVLFLAFAYIYVFLVIMGNSYYLILYSGKIIALEKMMNHFLEKEIFIWESYIMDKIQSPQNRFTKGYFNVNILKGAIAVVLYIVVEVILGIIWSLIFDDFIVTLIYCVAFGSLSGFVLMNWLKMWIHLPEYYKSCFIDLYKNKLQIKSED